MRTLVAMMLLVSTAGASKFVGPTEFLVEGEVYEMHKRLPDEVQSETIRWTVAPGPVAQVRWTKIVSVKDPWGVNPPQGYMPVAIYVTCLKCKPGKKVKLRLFRKPLYQGKLEIAGVIFSAELLE
jgi:hypothetical protein